MAASPQIYLLVCQRTDVQFLADAISNRILTKVPSVCLGTERDITPHKSEIQVQPTAVASGTKTVGSGIPRGRGRVLD